MHAREWYILGVGKGVLFREVSSVQECPYRERGYSDENTYSPMAIISIWRLRRRLSSVSNIIFMGFHIFMRFHFIALSSSLFLSRRRCYRYPPIRMGSICIYWLLNFQ